MIRRLLPHKLKVRIRVLQRLINDRRAKVKFAQTNFDEQHFEFSISTTQPVKQSNYFENKIENIKLGIKFVENLVIDSGETFSFWKAIGKPSPKRGFKIGRNLIGGKLQSDYGGGLCQLASIIYITALKAGLHIHERHNHTVDIYEDHERFTPLGSDATIVYGFKDLRILNPYPFAVQFRFSIEKDYTLRCELKSSKKIEERLLEFTRRCETDKIYVDTLHSGKCICTSTYLKSV